LVSSDRSEKEDLNSSELTSLDRPPAALRARASAISLTERGLLSSGEAFVATSRSVSILDTSLSIFSCLSFST
jgi:hypothetical protein